MSWLIIKTGSDPLLYRTHNWAGQGSWTRNKALASVFESRERAAAIAQIEGGMEVLA